MTQRYGNWNGKGPSHFPRHPVGRHSFLGRASVWSVLQSNDLFALSELFFSEFSSIFVSHFHPNDWSIITIFLSLQREYFYGKQSAFSELLPNSSNYRKIKINNLRTYNKYIDFPILVNVDLFAFKKYNYKCWLVEWWSN